MNFRRRIWGTVLWSWISAGLGLLFSLGMLGSHVDLDKLSVPQAGFIAASLFLALSGMLIFWHGLYALNRLHGAFFGKAPFQWHWTESAPFTALQPLRHVVQKFPAITPAQIHTALQDVRGRLLHTFSFLRQWMLSAAVVGILLGGTSFVRRVGGAVAPFILSLTGVAWSLLFFTWYHQGRRLQAAFMFRIENWAWGNLSWRLPEDKELSGPFLHDLLSQWLQGIENFGQLQTCAERRNHRLQELLLDFTEKTQKLADLMKNQHDILHRWVDEQLQSRHSMEKIAHRLNEGFLRGDEGTAETLQRLLIVCKEIQHSVHRVTE